MSGIMHLYELNRPAQLQLPHIRLPEIFRPFLTLRCYKCHEDDFGTMAQLDYHIARCKEEWYIGGGIIVDATVGNIDVTYKDLDFDT